MAYQDEAISVLVERPAAVDESLKNVPTELQHSTPCLAIYANDQYFGQNVGHLENINIPNGTPTCMARSDWHSWNNSHTYLPYHKALIPSCLYFLYSLYVLGFCPLN